jgi:hypothetical protein
MLLVFGHPAGLWGAPNSDWIFQATPGADALGFYPGSLGRGLYFLQEALSSLLEGAVALSKGSVECLHQP